MTIFLSFDVADLIGLVLLAGVAASIIRAERRGYPQKGGQR